MEPEPYGAAILGTGQAGIPMALGLGGVSRRTAVIDREYVGGTCVDVGCTPTKPLG
jgi:pyruvate/2-oxoglutarate dehydrogenase complex dihydrolipoamide dehydrogenase (E3) component